MPNNYIEDTKTSLARETKNFDFVHSRTGFSRIPGENGDQGIKISSHLIHFPNSSRMFSAILLQLSLVIILITIILILHKYQNQKLMYLWPN